MRFGIRYWLKFGNSLGNLETVWVLLRLKAQLLVEIWKQFDV
jgi:hypothetical protein